VDGFYTGMLNERRPPNESDLTVTRGFRVGLPAGQQRGRPTERDKHTHPLPDARRLPGAALVDLTSAYAGVRCDGGRGSRATLLASLSDADLSDEAFPVPGQQADQPRLLHRAGRPGSPTSAKLGLGAVMCRATSRSGVFDLLTRGLEVSSGWSTAGLLRHRVDAAREGFTGPTGGKLTPDYGAGGGPGLGFACKMRTDISFLGREAVEKARGRGPRGGGWLSLVASEPWHDDVGAAKLVLRDGVPVGQVTSAAWGLPHSALRACLAYIKDPAGRPR